MEKFKTVACVVLAAATAILGVQNVRMKKYISKVEGWVSGVNATLQAQIEKEKKEKPEE